MFKQLGRFCMIGAIGLMSSAAHAESGDTPSTEDILRAFAEDYVNDPSLLSADFGIKVGDEWYHIHAVRHEEPYEYAGRFTRHHLGPHDVTLHVGQPEEPTWYFELSGKGTLDNFYSGFWTAGSAAMQTYASDEVPLEIRYMDGAEKTRETNAKMYHALSHFWTRGTPEVTRFSRDSSLPTHGVSAVSLYTMKNNRIFWFSIGGNEVANEDANTEASEMPNLFIITKGRGVLVSDDGEMELEAGMSVFVGPYVKHTFYNPYEGETLEGIGILFGDNIDYAEGTSYPAFLEDYFEFLGDYPYAK